MNDLDQILDDAVKSYATVEPSRDFELRILSRVPQCPALRPARWPWLLGFSFTIAAVLMFAVVPCVVLPKPPAAITIVPTPAPNMLPRPAAVSLSRERREPNAHRSGKRRIIPSYSPEEIAALMFVQEHPKEAAQVAALQQQETKLDGSALHDDPIVIAPIQIRPITVPAMNQEDFR